MVASVQIRLQEITVAPTSWSPKTISNLVRSISSQISCFSVFFFSSRRRHTRLQGDWSSDVCSSDLRLLKLRHGRIEVCNLEISHPQIPYVPTIVRTQPDGCVKLADGSLAVSALHEIGRASCRERV